LLYQGQCLRLDRLAQLRDYRAAVQAIYPDAVVKAAFLTAHGALIEVNEVNWNSA